MSIAATANGRAELGRRAAEPLGLWSVLTARLTGLVERLPAHYDDIDPTTFKRLPVPY